MATSLTCYPTPHKMGRFEATPVIDDCGAVGLSTCPSRRGDDKNTVRVDVENDGLLYAMRRRRDARELELAEKVAAARHLALTLVYLDEHTHSVVGISAEDLRLLARVSRVALDGDRHLSTGGLDTDREG